jgi:hypothetical protein
VTANLCGFCKEACPDIEPCPFCNKPACVDHGSIIDFKDLNGTWEEYLWACDDCLDRMPDGGEGHWLECQGCQTNDKGCAVYQQLDAEYGRVMEPIIAAWKRGESVLGVLKRAGELADQIGTSQVPNVIDSLVRPSRE